MRRFKWLVASAVALSGFGCVPHSELELPSLDSLHVESALFVIVAPDGEAQAFALGPSTDPARFALSVPDDRVDLFVLGFGCELTTLEISPGPVIVANSGTADVRPLPEPDQILAAQLIDGVWNGAWQPLDAAPAALRNLRLRDLRPESRCSTFVSWDYDVGEAFGVPLVLPRGQGAIAAAKPVSLGDARFLEFTKTGTSVIAVYPSGMPQNAVYEAQDGLLWVLGTDGRVVRGKFPGAFEAVEPADIGGSNFGWLLGREGYDASLELFALSDEAGLASFDGMTWTLLRPRGRPILYGGGLTWGESGDLLALGAGRKVTRVSQGLPFDEDVSQLGSDSILTAIANAPNFGVVVAATGGEILRRTGGQWDAVSVNAANGAARGIAAFGNGFVVGRDAPPNSLQQFLPSGPCEPQAVLPAPAQQITPIRKGVAVSSLDRAARRAWFSIVEGQGGYPSCPGRGSILDLPP